MSKIGDEWETPQGLFDELDREFNFDIDLCSNGENSKCDVAPSNCFLWAISDDCIRSKSAFMNPPYSGPYEYIQTAYMLSIIMRVVCLVKCDTSTKWWGIFYDYEKQQPKPGIQIRYFPKRIKYEYKGQPVKPGPTFASALIIMDRRGL